MPQHKNYDILLTLIIFVYLWTLYRLYRKRGYKKRKGKENFKNLNLILQVTSVINVASLVSHRIYGALPMSVGQITKNFILIIYIFKTAEPGYNDIGLCDTSSITSDIL
jgi:hypothetical protein